MLLRALLVLLVILNFGVAAWWAVRGDAGDAHALAASDPGTLLLASEPVDIAAPGPADAPGHASTADVATAAEPPPAPAPEPVPVRVAADPPRCFALGPFADATAQAAARDRLDGLAVRTAPRDVSETPRGWRVWMAPLPDRAAADAVVVRLLAAGFNDYYVIGDGDEANGVALGRFGSEAPARSRAGALRDAGFEAEAQPLGSVLVRHWLDVMAAEDASAETLRSQVGAARVESRDCNASWVAG